MTINMAQIYSQLKAWRDERKITAESQKDGYLRNVMEEFGELAVGLRDYANWSKCDLRFCQIHKEMAERVIVDAICDISVLTINAGADIRDEYKPLSIDTTNTFSDLNCLLLYTSTFDFKKILLNCAGVCEKYGFNFEIAMLETIKEISSRTGSYNEATKKWEKDMSDEAQAKWYKADYELARIKK